MRASLYIDAFGFIYYRFSPIERKGYNVLTMRRLSGFTVSTIAIILLSSSLSIAAETTAYKVRKGDTLWLLARKHHTTVDALAKINGLNENTTLGIDKIIRIPSQVVSVKDNQQPKHISRANSLLHVRVDNVCLRTGPSTNESKITILKAGTSCKLVDICDRWAKIALDNGVSGYIHRSLLASRDCSTVLAKSEGDCDVAAVSDHSSVIQTALSCRGARYRSGGASRGGFDCSGFTRYVFAKSGISLPHSSAAQASVGSSISKSELRSGDLVFFQTNRRGISHVGIYIGNNQFVHAASRGRGVRVDNLSSSYYVSRYRGARRLNN